MRILKLLNRVILSIFIIFTLTYSNNLSAEEEPVDIWNLEKKKEQLDKDREEVTKLQKKKQKKLNNVNSMAKKQLDHQPESVPMSKKGALKNGGRWKRR